MRALGAQTNRLIKTVFLSTAQTNRLIKTVSFEYPQHIIWMRNKENSFSNTHSYLEAWTDSKALGCGVYKLKNYIFKKEKLPVGESNPGLPRDRRGYLPLY